MELRPLAYYRRNSSERGGTDNLAFSHFSHRDHIVNSSVTPIRDNNIPTVLNRGEFLINTCMEF